VLGLAPWLEARLEVGPLTVTPGVRLEASLIETSRLLPQQGLTPPVGSDRTDVALDPRVAARLRVSSRVTFGASVGRYHQPPTPQDLSAVFGTPALISSSALHATALASVTPLSPADGLTIDAVGFYKQLSNLPVRTRAATPRLAAALVQDGEGRAYGLELLVRKKLSRGLFGWISYTLSRSERRYVGEPSHRLFDGDRPHVLAVVASQEVGAWTFGARFRYASGLPQTAVVSAYQDLRGDRWEPIFGAQNASRLPAFYALDLRVERALVLSEQARLVLSLDVLDATFHKNAEAVAYAPSFGSHAYITGLPTVALVGAKVEL
jgi:outer membrane receptor protein involved in Fe transport